MVKKIGLGIASVVVAFLIFVAVKPAHYVISRTITINAPAEKVFPYLNNPKLAHSWMPWNDIDPDAKMVYSGPAAGVGARTDWDAGKQLGTGSATVIESVPNEKVRIKLEYVKPMPLVQDADYMLQASGKQSVMTWRVQGENNFMGRLMCMFVNMDKMVGGMFEQGLTKLKALAEKA